MVKKSSLNGVLLVFSLLAALGVFVLGEILLRFVAGLPFFLQTAIYLTFVTVSCFVAIFVSEKISSGYYIPRGRVTFAGTCAKAAAIFVPCAFVLGLLTQLIYGFAGVTTEAIGVREGGTAYRSHYVFESEEMYSVLRVGRECGHFEFGGFRSDNPISTSALESAQILQIGAGGNSVALEGFDLGMFMQNFYASTYAGRGGFPARFDDLVAEMFVNPQAGDFSIHPRHADIFLSVLENGFNNGLASVEPFPHPITGITASVSIFDGAGLDLDAGKIDIIFDVSTSDGSDMVFQNIGCTPSQDPLIADTFGHGFIHSGFDNRQLPAVNVYRAYVPHLLHVAPNDDNAFRLPLQALVFAAWGIFVGFAIVVFLNNNALFTSFLIPRAVVSVVVAIVVAVMMSSVGFTMLARGLLALGMCLLYLPTFSWGNTVSPDRPPASPAGGW